MNLPNKLSIARICMVPLFVIFYFLPYAWGSYVAVALFILAAFTDFLDGYIARKYNLVSDLGKLLDPIADKILVCAALFCVVASNPLALFPSYADCEFFMTYGSALLAVCATLILARELLISAVRMIAASKGIVVQANVYGKIKTILQDVALPILVLANGVKQQCLLGFNLPGLSSLLFDTELQALRFLQAISWIGVILFLGATIMTVVSGVIYMIQNKKVFADDKNNC